MRHQNHDIHASLAWKIAEKRAYLARLLADGMQPEHRRIVGLLRWIGKLEQQHARLGGTSPENQSNLHLPEE